MLLIISHGLERRFPFIYRASTAVSKVLSEYLKCSSTQKHESLLDNWSVLLLYVASCVSYLFSIADGFKYDTHEPLCRRSQSKVKVDRIQFWLQLGTKQHHMPHSLQTDIEFAYWKLSVCEILSFSSQLGAILGSLEETMWVMLMKSLVFSQRSRYFLQSCSSFVLMFQESLIPIQVLDRLQQHCTCSL